MLRAVLRPAVASATAAAAAGGLTSAQADYRGPESALNYSSGGFTCTKQPKASNVSHLSTQESSNASPIAPKPGLEEEWSVIDRGEDGEFAAMLLERPPQRIEIQEAAEELEAMFNREAYDEHNDSGASSDTETELASPALKEEPPVEDVTFSRTRGVDAIMTHWRDPAETAAIARRRNGAMNVVARAFELMEKDPEVRETVVDLATDPNIWQAVMNNQALRNLRAKRQVARIHGEDEPSVNVLEEVAAHEDKNSERPTSGIKIQSLFGHIGSGIARLLETCMDMVNGIQAFIQKQVLGTGVGGAGEGDCAMPDPYLQAVGTIVVLLIAAVVIKRAP